MAVAIQFNWCSVIEKPIFSNWLLILFQLSIDHRQQYVTFGSTLVVAMREDVAEGPFIQVCSKLIPNK